MVSTGSFIAEMSILGIGLVALFGASYMLNKTENVSNKTRRSMSKPRSRSKSKSSSSIKYNTNRYSLSYKSDNSK